MPVPPDLLLAGTLTAASGTTALAAAALDGGTDLAPYLGGGAGAAAVTGLVYVVRAILTGRLVPREVAEHDREQGAAIREAAVREQALRDLVDRLEQLVTEGREREHEGRAREISTAQLAGDATRALEEIADHMTYWRAQREARGGI